MRFATLLFGCLLSGLALSQGGVFKPAGGEEARWSINPNHVLLWNATPYLPFGLRIGASESEILEAKRGGILDVLVDCPPQPAQMKAAVEVLEREGMRYLLAISSLAPTARGVLVEPQGNRFTGITAERNLNFRIPGADEALVVLAVRRDGFIQSSQRVKGQDGRFTVTVKPPNDLEHVALIYPFTSTHARLGTWESFDRHRDSLLVSLWRASLGKGFRGIVNPLGTFVAQTGPRNFVPTGPLFRFEMAAYLKQRYRSPLTAMRSWSMAGTDEKSFDDLARLVPLWVAGRGVASLWDPNDNALYAADMRRSTIWQDFEIVLAQSESRRSERLVGSIRRIADVPVVQEWAGWSPLYEGSSHGLNGIGARSFGATVSAVSETAARAASSLLRWPKSGWFVATHVDLSGVPEAPGQLNSVLDDLVSMGIRGAYLRTQEAPLLTALVGASGRSGDASLAQWTVKPIFYPEGATNPATSMRLPGGTWWLPAPGTGNRLDLGSLFYGYRTSGAPESSYAIWSRVGKVRVKLNLANPNVAVFQTVDGSDPKPKLVKGGVEVDLSELPLTLKGIDEMPVPEPAFEELLGRFEQLLREADRRLMDTTEERFLFRDYLNGYPRTPGANFALLYNVFAKLSARLARYLWVEAEATRESSFSEVLNIPGMSGVGALALRTQLETDAMEYTAEYSLQPRTEEELEVWVAARIGRSDREKVRLTIGGQDLIIEGEPTSGYGGGFAWYPMGKTRLGRQMTKAILKVKAPEGIDMAVDAILFYPGEFRPNGITPPDVMAFGG